MMRKTIFCVSTFLLLVFSAFAQEEKKVLALDDFEDELIAGESVAVGIGKDSMLEISADKAVKMSGSQSLKIIFDSVADADVWLARGYDLGVKGAEKWLVDPAAIEWDRYGALSFFFLGSSSGSSIAFEIKDSGNELFRFIVVDESKHWRSVVCPFSEFFSKADGQPEDAAVNGIIDFPLKSFKFEPIAVSMGEYHVDEVVLEPLN